MAFKRELCKAWVQERIGGGDQFVSYVVTSTRTPLKPQVGMNSTMKFNGREIIRERTTELGLAEENKVGQFVTETFLALSDERVFYGSRSFFRNRPKDLLHEAPASDFAIHWVDDDVGAGNRFRHLLLDFGGGAWRTDRIGLAALGRDQSKATNLDEFFSALGERSHQITV